MRQAARWLTGWELLLLLALLLPLIVMPPGWWGVVLLGPPLLWGVRRFGTGRWLVATPLDTAVLALAIALLISQAAVFDITLSFPKIAGLVMGIALFYAAVAAARRSRGGMWPVVALYLGLGSALAAAGLAGSSWMGTAGLARLQALWPTRLSAGVNANELAGVLGWIAPLAIGLVASARRPLWRRHKGLWLLLAGVALFSGALLIATRSRGGWLSLAVSLLVMLAISTRTGKWLLVAALIAGVTLGFYLDLNAVFAGDNTGSGAEIGLAGRVEIWSRAVYGLQDFPLTGVSMNGFRRVVHILYPLFLISPDTDITHAHNQLLQAGLDLGLPGLCAYLALWWLCAGLLWHSWRRLSGDAERALVLGLSGALTAGWIFGLLDAVTLGARPAFMWWLLLALVVAVHDRVSVPG